MSKWRSRWSNLVLNAAIVVFGALALVLLFSLVTRALAPRTDPLRDANAGSLVGEIIQVEVLNGAGVDELAARATAFLRQRGFDVVYSGDHDTFELEESLVIDRVGDIASAKKVANALGIAEENIREEIQESLYLDSSVIIGQDFRGLRPFKNDN